jgi:ABC-2 type transport system permease protein
MAHNAGRVVLATTTRRAVRAGAIWGLVFGGLVAASAFGYDASFPTAESRAKLAASFESNAGIAALLGPARRLDTVAGFTAWRTMGVLTIVGAIWGMLLATRATRGEEDAGRWELVLSGATTRRRASIDAMLGLALGWLALWAVTAVLAVLVGSAAKVSFSVTASLFLATAVCTGAGVFLAVGVLAAQLASSRRRANLIAAAVLGVAFLVRMVADSVNGLHGLRWLSPLGWIEELRPLTGSRPWLLLALLAVVALCGVASALLAGARDLGAGPLASRDRRPARVGLLGNALGLTIRLTLPVIVAWLVALALFGLILGLVAPSAAEAVSGSTVIADVIGRLGGSAAGASAYLGLTFVIAAGLIAVAAAGQVAATGDEEAEGRADNVLGQPVARRSWLAGRVAVAAVLVALAGVLVGMAAWAGSASQSAGIDFGTLVKAGVNVAPPGLFVLGLGTFVFGVWPRRATLVAYAVVVWSFLVATVASVLSVNHWLLDTSVLQHVTPAPAAPPDWTSAGVLVALAAVGALLGVAGFSRRDLVSA